MKIVTGSAFTPTYALHESLQVGELLKTQLPIVSHPLPTTNGKILEYDRSSVPMEGLVCI